jgi:hypothetical protein
MTFELWNEGGKYRELLLRYNARDSQLLRKLEAKKGYIALFQSLCEVCGIVASTQSLFPTRQMDGFMLRLGRDRDHRFPTKSYRDDDDLEEEQAKYRGAFVMHPKTVGSTKDYDEHAARAWRLANGMTNGILFNVHVCDFASLYPSVMRSWNLSGDVVLGWGKTLEAARKQYGNDVCVSPGTDLVTRTDVVGFLPLALAELIRLRKEFSDLAASLPPGTVEWNDAMSKSTAYKVAANSFYGAGGSKYSRFNHRDVSEACTQNAVHLLKLTAAEAERRSMVVVYGDTDSVFVIGPSEEGYRKFVSWLNAKRFPEEVASYGCKENHIKLAFEKTFARLVFISAKAYCNPPEAPVWMGDLSFKRLGDVKPGDEVVGWNEGDRRNGSPRTTRGFKRKKLTKATVVGVSRSVASLVKVTMASGRVIRCTPDHQWLRSRLTQQTKENGKRYEYRWCSPGVGRELVHVVDPPKPLPRSMLRDAAWLGGLWDGEGSCASTGRSQITLSQSEKVNPEVCAEIERVMKRLGFDFGRWKRPSGDVFAIRGAKQTRLDFLTWCKPIKRSRLSPGILKSKFGTADKIVSIVPDGEGEVISLTTTTGNYVAWGYASKNCGRYTQYKGKPADRECHDVVFKSTETCATCGGAGKLAGDPEIKGLAWKRGDKGKLARELQGRIIDCLVGGVKVRSVGGKKIPINADLELDTPTDAVEVYKMLVERAQKHVLEDDLPITEVRFSKGLSKSLREYGKEANDAHVRVARILKERGQVVSKGSRIEFVVVDDSTSPQQVISADDYTGACDRYYLWERVYSPTKALLEAAFPEQKDLWEKFGKVRPPKERTKKHNEAQLGFMLTQNGPGEPKRFGSNDELAMPAYRASDLVVRIPESAGKDAIARVYEAMKAHPGARKTVVVIALNTGAEAMLATSMRVSPGPNFKADIDAAITGDDGG